ncbi:fimbrillin family protein, partial [Parabacteroides distasonis]
TTVTVHDGTMTSNSQNDIKPNITTENGYTTYTALLPPQTIMANTGFIKVTMDGKALYYRPAKEITLEAGKTYNYQIKVGVSGYKIDANGVYHVDTPEGLKAWAEAVKNNPAISCILENNITMPAPEADDGSNWIPVSSGFNGTFDGNSKIIKGLVVNSTESYIGFIKS